MKRNLCLLLVLCLLFVGGAGCTKEKAIAIKGAAGKFREEAVAALDQVSNLIKQGISMPVESSEEKINIIVFMLKKEGSVNASTLSELLTEDSIGSGIRVGIEEEFEKLKEGYYLLEGMFRSLPAGSYFAKGAVEKAEKHAINLTLDLMGFARKFRDWPVQFAGRRILIIEKTVKAKAITDLALRELHYKLVAQDIMLLKKDETEAKEKAVKQCLKASEAGKLVAELIRRYGNMSIGDMLVMANDSLSFVDEISGSSDLNSVMREYKSVEDAIKSDPYWSKIVDIKINP
jgi:hypothetical protein